MGRSAGTRAQRSEPRAQGRWRQRLLFLESLLEMQARRAHSSTPSAMGVGCTVYCIRRVPQSRVQRANDEVTITMRALCSTAQDEPRRHISCATRRPLFWAGVAATAPAEGRRARAGARSTGDSRRRAVW